MLLCRTATMAPDMAAQPNSLISTLGGLVSRARQASKKPGLRALLLTAGFVLFVVLAVGSFRSLPAIESPTWWAAAVLVFVTTPLTLALNTAEFRLIAATAGSPFDWGKALSTTVVASLANLLPVPGAAAVRTTALMRSGASLRVSGEANVLAAFVWLGATAALAGLGLVASDTIAAWVSILVLTVGVVVSASAMWRIQALASSQVAARLLVIEVATVLTSAVRVWLGYEVIRQSIGFGESIAISSGVVLAALVGFVPGGLGIREVLAGGLASLIGQASAAAIAATVVDRLAAQIGMVLVLLALLLIPSGPGRAALQEFRERSRNETGEES